MEKGIIYKKTLQFGKIDYYGNGRHVNAVSIDVELRQCGGEKTFTIDKETKERIYTGNETEKYVELSICGNIWNGNHSDIICGGQCIDTIAEHIKTPKMQEIVKIWKRWHLNGLKAACEHQRALGWEEMVDEDITLYHWNLNAETITAKNKAKEEALDAAKRGETFTPNAAAVRLLSLDYLITTEADELEKRLEPYYEPAKPLYTGDKGHIETKKRGWTRPEEHPDGLLGAPCPICGYKYGSAWLHETLPDDVVTTVKNW